MFFLKDKIFILKGKVQHYDWGGYHFIPSWLGIENTAHKPFAEYWMGAHPSAPAMLCTKNGELSLYQLISNYPEEILGSAVKAQFKELPYLFKILDVREMLSIQVHPNKMQALSGFEKEEAAGIIQGAAHRIFKDKNHKPEVMVALSDFWLLHGFMPSHQLAERLHATPPFESLVPVFENGSYKALYEYVMNMPQEEVNRILGPLLQTELANKAQGKLNKKQPGWWASRLEESRKDERIDRGIFSVYFLNIVALKKGEGIFQAPGIPHAYLEGQNVELMANSDNVLRGGLTKKYVDIEALLHHTYFKGIEPQILYGEEIQAFIKSYQCPVSDFGIEKIELPLGKQTEHASFSFEIWVIMKGSALFSGATSTIEAHQGQAVAILANEHYTVAALQDLEAYKAFVPSIPEV